MNSERKRDRRPGDRRLMPIGEVLVANEDCSLRKNKDGVVFLTKANINQDLRVDDGLARAVDAFFEHGLPIHPSLVDFLARDDVHAALKRLAEES